MERGSSGDTPQVSGDTWSSGDTPRAGSHPRASQGWSCLDMARYPSPMALERLEEDQKEQGVGSRPGGQRTSWLVHFFGPHRHSRPK